jgi:glycosyltransferase involved in cell wall biosynthesis
MADAVIAKSAVCQRALVSDGYDAKKVHRIDNGFPSQPTRTTQTRLDARRSLGLMNSDLAAEADAPVLLCVSRMTRSSGMNQLVGAARHLIAKFPDLRIWLVGDGPHRDWMYEQLRGDGVRASIAMPGSFCDMDEVFAAADLYLQSDDSGLDSFLPKAISNELPVVTVDTESTRSVIVGSTTTEPSTGSTPTAESLVHWCPGATPKNFRIGITSILNDLTSAQEKASELRRIAVRSRPLQNCVADHVNLMQRLIEQNSPPKNGSSREALS